MESNTNYGSNETEQVKIYKYRWIILILFCLYAAINILQFMQYPIIANIIIKYYNIDNFSVDLTSLIFMISYIILFLPGSYLMQKCNLRQIAILTCVLTAIGNFIKVFSIAPDRFYLVIFGQLFCGVAQVFLLGIPPQLASVWFGPSQVSTACAIAVLGMQLGAAAGTIISPLVVINDNKIENIGNGLFTMLTYNAGVTCLILLLTIFFFKSKPKLPPSQSQLNILETNGKESLLATIKKLLLNRDYVLILIAFGIPNGIINSLSITLNRVYLHYFPGAETDVGIIALIIIISGGCFGTLFFGFILDKTHHFKLISSTVMTISALSLTAIYWAIISESRLGARIVSPFLGFFMVSIIVIGLEFATEITYPLSPAICCSVLNAFIFIFTIIITLMLEVLFDLIGFIPAFVIIVVILLICSMLVYFISPNLNRRQANIVYNNKVNT